MADIIVSTFNIPNWHYGGTTAKLRLYSSIRWTDSNGVPHIGGTAGAKIGFYQEVACTVTGTSVTVPAFTTPSTLDSPDFPTARVTAVLFDQKGTPRDTLFTQWFIPTSPTTTTWEALSIVNLGRGLVNPSDTWLNAVQVQALIDAGVHGFDNLNVIDVSGAGAITPATILFDAQVIIFTGVLTGDRTVNWPGTTAQITFWNATTGNFNLYVKTPTESTGVRVQKDRQAILINDLTHVTDITAGISQVPFFVLEFDGSQQTVDFGQVWSPFTYDLGPFLYEGWVKLGVGSHSGLYIISDGFGGAHAILWGAHNGNVWDGTNTTSISADFVPYIGQWALLAFGWDGASRLIMYYDGVPVGGVDFAGPRRTPGTSGGGGVMFVGGSDHQNFIGRMAQIRGFEGANPVFTQYGLAESTYEPQTVFGSQWGLSSSYPTAAFLADFFRPDQIIVNKGRGVPAGDHFSGHIRGSGFNVTSNKSSYPAPQFVIDPDVPNALGLTAIPQPAGKVYTPAATPSGALVFDSFERKNSTYAFDGVGGLGSTESGSLGVLPWVEIGNPGPTDIHTFGILNEHAVVLANTVIHARALVASTNLDIRVDRHNTAFAGAGISTGIIFRYVDASNYCFAFTDGTALNNQTLFCGTVTAGVTAYPVAFNLAMPSSWTTLRVITKSDGTLKVYADATNLVDTTLAAFQSATGGAGLYNWAAGRALRNRWKNFTIFTAS